MLITSMNQTSMPGVLVAILAPDHDQQRVDVANQIARVYDPLTDQTLGYNFLQVQKIDPEISGNGALELSQTQVAHLNAALSEAGFKPELILDPTPKFVVGYVEKTEPHPDSDHLLVTQTRVDHDQILQIVSGSPNMREHIFVVVAKVGALMPSGQIIWPGELRGVPSDGMITSGRELHLMNAPQKKGALILSPDFAPVGTPFSFEQGNKLFS